MFVFLLTVCGVIALIALKSVVSFKSDNPVYQLGLFKETFYDRLAISSEEKYYIDEVIEEIDRLSRDVIKHLEDKRFSDLNSLSKLFISKAIEDVLPDIKDSFRLNCKHLANRSLHDLYTRASDFREDYERLEEKFPQNIIIHNIESQPEDDSVISKSLKLNVENLNQLSIEHKDNPEIQSMVSDQVKQIHLYLDNRKEQKDSEEIEQVKSKLKANKIYLNSVEKTNWD